MSVEADTFDFIERAEAHTTATSLLDDLLNSVLSREDIWRVKLPRECIK